MKVTVSEIRKKLLTAVAKEKGYTNLLIYIDDGISGVTMNRPDYIRMIEDFENNKSSALFVKDLSPYRQELY